MSIRRNIVLFAISIFASPAVYCQAITVSGQLFQESNGAPISNVVLKLAPDNQITSSGENGQYMFLTTPGIKHISTRVLGYEIFNESFEVYSDTTIDIYLNAHLYEINEVTVTEDSARTIIYTDKGNYTIIPAAINETPRLFSEPDLIKSLQILPGVVSGKDGSADIYVRGGGLGQNVVTANGCTFFLPNHLLGLSSPYNLDFLESAELYKDYIPAGLGGGASSVIQLKYKKSQIESIGAQARFGLLSSGLSVELPVKKINLGISGGIRIGNYSIYSAALKKILSREITDHLPSENYSFYDVYLKISQNSRWGTLNYLYIGNSDKGTDERVTESYYADTLVNYSDGISTGWNSAVHAIQWESPGKGPLIWKIGLNYNRLRIGRDIYKETEKFLNDSEMFSFSKTSYSFSPTIESLGTSFSVTWSGSRINLAGGLSNRIRLFSPNVSAQNENNGIVTNNDLGESSKVYEPAAFISSKFIITKKLHLDAGFRFSGGIVEKAVFRVSEPRLRLSYNPGGIISPHINYVRLSQFDHSLEGSSAGLRSMIWVPVSEEFGPELSEVISAGIHSHLNNQITLTTDAYFKTISDMLDFIPGASFIYDDSFLDLLEQVDGRAWGIETSLAVRFGRISGFTSYTWSRSQREWHTPEGLIWIPTQADRPHSISQTLKYRLGRKTSFGLNWVFQSGAPATIYMHNTSYGEFFETKNNIRFFDYHRLDISLRQTLYERKVSVLLDLDIYNLYNRSNTFYFQESYDEENNRYYYKNISLFPIMPSISVTLRY